MVGKCHGVEPCCASLPFACSKHVISQPELEHYYPTAPKRNEVLLYFLEKSEVLSAYDLKDLRGGQIQGPPFKSLLG